MVLSLGLLVPEAPLDGGAFREWLRAAGKEFWSSPEKHQMRAFRSWIVR